MTNEEIKTREQRLSERQLELQSVMSASDAHCLKCYKMGLSFQKTYPEDWAVYEKAREEYNANEQLIAELRAQAAEEEPQYMEEEVINND